MNRMTFTRAKGCVVTKHPLKDLFNSNNKKIIKLQVKKINPSLVL